MSARRNLALGAAFLSALSALAAAACTASDSHTHSPGTAGASTSVGASSGSVSVARAAPPKTLAAFRSCASTLAGLRAATEASVTPYGLPGGPGGGYDLAPNKAVAFGAAASAAPAAAAAAGTAGGSASGGAAPAYSGTNVATPGVDEPDMVKSDGRRIVTTADGILTVVDAATGQVTGKLALPSAGVSGVFEPTSLPMMAAPGLLLSGDHALVLEDGYGPPRDGLEAARTVLYLIDVSGQPSIISTYTIDGSLVDARMIGSVVRAITDVRPQIIFPAASPKASPGQLLAANRAAIAHAPLTSWLPQFESTGGGATIDGQVPCTTISRPAVYSGTSLLSVETFDLSAPALGTGSAVSIEADGNTVYGTASSLYIASGNQWMASPVLEGGAVAGGAVAEVPRPGGGIRQQTQIYRFALQGSAPPAFAASGTVPGYLVDQYALSEWGGYLRVATTTGLSWALADGPPSAGASGGSPPAQPSSSAVYVLSAAGPVMQEVGKLTGLGLDERIYSVRYEGPVGYVVTFRQTDPLYTVDLSDPAHPRLAGHLSLTGYSSYLQPTSTTRLIGIGQRADAVGHREGTQVSLFDVANLAAPSRLSMYSLAGTMSDAENDPHAFLYWPSAQLVVVPITDSGGGAQGSVPNGALVLRIDGTQLVPVGEVQQPQVFSYDEPIMRTLVIGQTLWTLSPAGLMASDLTTLHQESWLRLT